MMEIRIKKDNGYAYEQYETKAEVYKRLGQLMEKGIPDDNIKVTSYVI